MDYKGRVWKFGDNIDTDLIFPSQYMLLPTIEEMKVHAFEPLVANFHEKVRPGDMILGGENFGGGSSREQAPSVLKAVGITCIIAKSFARIFYRNAINIGLLAFVCNCYDEVHQGDVLSVDLARQTIEVEGSGLSFGFKSFPPHVTQMVAAGGLIEYINGSGR
jgi:3-isopropylmalate/(R)-2-methylmalate dehydratase small subunit